MRGSVKNSLARHNICFSEYEQEPDIESGCGTIVSFDSVPGINSIRKVFPEYLGDKAAHLYAEGNKYYDISKCGIGYYGDSERRIVVGIRLGSPMDLSYIWFHDSKPIGSRFKITMKPGDIYVMSDKAVGYDLKKRTITTLRHAAGCNKYTKIPDK